jgi:hypothetical protein
MRALCRMDNRKLAEILETSLKKLGYSYIKNQGRSVTEFEVRSPCQFLAAVEDLTRQRLSFLVRSPVVVESAVELRRLVGATGPPAELSACASALARELRSALPNEPWKGVGAHRSRAARSNWENLGEL